MKYNKIHSNNICKLLIAQIYHKNIQFTIVKPINPVFWINKILKFQMSPQHKKLNSFLIKFNILIYSKRNKIQ